MGTLVYSETRRHGQDVWHDLSCPRAAHPNSGTAPCGVRAWAQKPMTEAEAVLKPRDGDEFRGEHSMEFQLMKIAKHPAISQSPKSVNLTTAPIIRLARDAETSVWFRQHAELASTAPGGPRAAATVLMRAVADEYSDRLIGHAANYLDGSASAGPPLKYIEQERLDEAASLIARGASVDHAARVISDRIGGDSNARRNNRRLLIRRLKKNCP